MEIVSTRRKGLMLLVALGGITVCLVSLVGFVAMIGANNLDWHPGQSAREFYQAIGESYSQGFLVGFFLCFFLTMVAVIVDRAWRERQARRQPAGRSLATAPE